MIRKMTWCKVFRCDRCDQRIGLIKDSPHLYGPFLCDYCKNKPLTFKRRGRRVDSWTEGEDKLLKELYMTTQLIDIASRLNKTKGAVLSEVRRLCLHKQTVKNKYKNIFGQKRECYMCGRDWTSKSKDGIEKWFPNYPTDLILCSRCCNLIRNRGRGIEPKATGERHHSWKGGRKTLRKQIQTSRKAKRWRHAVFKRDHYRCQNKDCEHLCKYWKIQAHHIVSVMDILDMYNIKTLWQAQRCKPLWDTNNGVTLCFVCHKKTFNYGSYAKVPHWNGERLVYQDNELNHEVLGRERH